jgi:hypothetical protein
MKASAALLLLCFLLASPGTAVAGPELVEKNATVTAVVEEEDFDGLTATTDSGVIYSIWTPPSVDYERLSAFHRKYKKKPVTFRGDVYKDERGLSIAVDSLPGTEQ